MMKRGHLHLVANNAQTEKLRLKEKIQNYLNDIFISRNEKIFILKDSLINIYRDYEITTGIKDIPYFVKAESKLRQIIQENKVNYYYNRLKKFRKNV